MNFISIDAVSEKANISLFLNNESVFKYMTARILRIYQKPLTLVYLKLIRR